MKTRIGCKIKVTISKVVTVRVLQFGTDWLNQNAQVARGSLFTLKNNLLIYTNKLQAQPNK